MKLIRMHSTVYTCSARVEQVSKTPEEKGSGGSSSSSSGGGGVDEDIQFMS